MSHIRIGDFFHKEYLVRIERFAYVANICYIRGCEIVKSNN